MDIDIIVVQDLDLIASVVLLNDALYVDGLTGVSFLGDQVAIEALGTMLPVGDQLLGQTEVAFSLSKLVPLIASVGNQGEDYVFTLEVTDEKDQQLVKSVVFYNPVIE